MNDCEKILLELEKWKRALVSLTVGGSEFVDDSEYCVQTIKEHQQFQHQKILELTKANKLMSKIIKDNIHQNLASEEDLYKIQKFIQ